MSRAKKIITCIMRDCDEEIAPGTILCESHRWMNEEEGRQRLSRTERLQEFAESGVDTWEDDEKDKEEK